MNFPVKRVGPSPPLTLVEPVEFPTFMVLLWMQRVGDHNEESRIYLLEPEQLKMAPDGLRLWGQCGDGRASRKTVTFPLA